MKKIYFGFCVFAVLFVGLFFYHPYEARNVWWKPDGFVPLIELNNMLKNRQLQFRIWEQAITLEDELLNSGIYQTTLSDYRFIVKYHGQYFINEEQCEDAIEAAIFARNKRGQKYHLGDTIEFFGVEETIKIVAVSSTVEGQEGIYKKLSFDYLLSSNATAKEIYVNSTITTKDGVQYSNIFLKPTKTSAEIAVDSEVSKGENEIESITLFDPKYWGVQYIVEVAPTKR